RDWSSDVCSSDLGASSGSPLGAGVNGLATPAPNITCGGSGWGGNGGGGSGGGQRGGGGVGGPSVGAVGGPGLPEGTPVLDPLLRDCVAPPNNLQGLSNAGADGQPGQGGVGGGSGGGGGGGGGFGGGGGSSSGSSGSS